MDCAEVNGVAKRIMKESGKRAKVENGKKESDKGKTFSRLPDKEFKHQESLLTEMLKVSHLKNMFYIAYAIFITLFINSLVYDYFYGGNFKYGLSFLIVSFEAAPTIARGWFTIFFINLFTYHSFHIWAFVYEEVFGKYGTLRKLWNYFGAICLLYYILKSMKFAGDFVWEHELSFAGSVTILAEVVRHLMKSYAFIRHNVEKVVTRKHNAKSSLKLPTFRKYVKFLFFPTLVYKDKYPRSQNTRWNLVAWYFLEVFMAAILISYISEVYFVHTCFSFSTSTYTFNDIIWSTLRNTLPSFAIMLLMFYLLLHAWMNAFAEITKFGDRLFYLDWWNSTSFEVYYRKWNLVVQEWLYMYIYKDVHDFITPGNKVLAKVMVFMLSYLAHEYIAYYTLRFFFPYLVIFFLMLGGALSFVKLPKLPLMQVLFHYGYALGLSIGLTGYMIEFCVRRNDCVNNRQFLDYELRSYSEDCMG